MTSHIYASGKRVLVSDEDHAFALQHTWWLDRKGYVYTTIRKKAFRLHRLLLNPPSHLMVDHINGDRLDNRRSNLRVVTPSQNGQNVKGARIDSGTGIRNVYALKSGRYTVRIWIEGRAIRAGSYDTLEEAKKAASAARAQYMTHAPENNLEATP